MIESKKRINTAKVKVKLKTDNIVFTYTVIKLHISIQSRQEDRRKQKIVEAGVDALTQLTSPIQPEIVIPAVKVPTETTEEEVQVDCICILITNLHIIQLLFSF